MTPFMLRVAELIGDDVDADEIPMPMTRPSARYAANEGADRQVALRCLAEQLICEANAVLEAPDDHLSLDDEVGGDELAFVVHYRGRYARVSTRFEDHKAIGRLVGDGILSTEPRELVGPEALPDLIMLLLVEAGAVRHPHAPYLA